MTIASGRRVQGTQLWNAISPRSNFGLGFSLPHTPPPHNPHAWRNTARQRFSSVCDLTELDARPQFVIVTAYCMDSTYIVPDAGRV
jgi:hypothetical protein